MSNPTHVAAPLVRLNKLLVSKVGGMSRREADRLIVNDSVRVNGKIVNTLGAKFDETARVELCIPTTAQRLLKTTVVLHKPLGVVSCQPDTPPYYTPAIQLLTERNRHGTIAPDKGHDARLEPYRLPKMAVAGRLDINTSGLLLFTQCGKMAADIIGPQSKVEKEYLVRWQSRSTIPNVSVSITNPALLAPVSNDYVMECIDRLRRGVDCSGERLQAVSVDVLNAHQLRIVLREGKKHHIRRMVESVGWRVQALKRVRIGNVALGSLPRGQWRYLQPQETVL
jgi:23S rRNA pseudouridine2604 synthase